MNYVLEMFLLLEACWRGMFRERLVRTDRKELPPEWQSLSDEGKREVLNLLRNFGIEGVRELLACPQTRR